MTQISSSPILVDYQNGGYNVKIYKDGTKVRTQISDQLPAHIESCDFKITDYCDAGCSFCHESSTTRGQHAEISTILNLIEGLPPGIEFAIGGGNPLSHPKLEYILSLFRERGFISNLTVNTLHLSNKTLDILNYYRRNKLIWGLGISYQYGYDAIIKEAVDENTIIHVIMGIHNPSIVYKSVPHNKLLILGYKDYGRGLVRKLDIRASATKWGLFLGLLANKFQLSFDSLAVDQLQLLSALDPAIIEKHYMGADGAFTMYVDAVSNSYAVSSVKTRFPIINNIKTSFKVMQSTLTVKPQESTK